MYKYMNTQKTVCETAVGVTMDAARENLLAVQAHHHQVSSEGWTGH